MRSFLKSCKICAVSEATLIVFRRLEAPTPSPGLQPQVLVLLFPFTDMYLSSAILTFNVLYYCEKKTEVTNSKCSANASFGLLRLFFLLKTLQFLLVGAKKIFFAPGRRVFPSYATV